MRHAYEYLIRRWNNVLWSRQMVSSKFLSFMVGSLPNKRRITVARHQAYTHMFDKDMCTAYMYGPV